MPPSSAIADEAARARPAETCRPASRSAAVDGSPSTPSGRVPRTARTCSSVRGRTRQDRRRSVVVERRGVERRRRRHAHGGAARGGSVSGSARARDRRCSASAPAAAAAGARRAPRGDGSASRRAAARSSGERPLEQEADEAARWLPRQRDRVGGQVAVGRRRRVGQRGQRELGGGARRPGTAARAERESRRRSGAARSGGGGRHGDGAMRFAARCAVGGAGSASARARPASACRAR